MDTQDLANGSANPIKKIRRPPTVYLDCIVQAPPVSEDGNDEESHEPCGTSYLFTPGHMLHRTSARYPINNTISKLRLEAADACHSCEIVLDALNTYCSGIQPLDCIDSVDVRSAERSITVTYRPAEGASQGREESDWSSSENVRIQLLRLEGQDLHITHNVTHKELPILTPRLPSGDTSSDQALRTLYNWIETCVTHHGACTGHNIHKLPKRILEIDGQHVYLREHLSTPAIYTCLSHCWGPSGPTIRLDKTSLSLFMDGIPIDQLPKTFADSIHLTARLGFRFIWIDACCIMQDDKDDWKEAAATMAEIYERAHLTIAATWAKDSNCGLFASDRERYQARRLRDCDLYVREIVNDFPHEFVQSDDFPLLTRAWVYQERLLSSRMVHFAKDQMYWQCSTLFTAEGGATYDAAHPPREHSKIWPCFGVSEDPISRWREVVTSYIQLNLTYASDRLPAIAAIVEREMRLRPDDTYVAGMWKSSLLTDICWQRDWGTGDPPVARLKGHFPTWAWPSSEDQFIWKKFPTERSLRLVELSFTRIGPAQVGHVLNASIILEGHTFINRLTQLCDPKDSSLAPRMELSFPACKDFQQRPFTTRLDFDWRFGDWPIAVGDSLLVMAIETCLNHKHSYSTGIILHEIADGTFERMGVINFTEGRKAGLSGVEAERAHMEFIETLPIRQVKII